MAPNPGWHSLGCLNIILADESLAGWFRIYSSTGKFMIIVTNPRQSALYPSGPCSFVTPKVPSATLNTTCLAARLWNRGGWVTSGSPCSPAPSDVLCVRAGWSRDTFHPVACGHFRGLRSLPSPEAHSIQPLLVTEGAIEVN